MERESRERAIGGGLPPAVIAIGVILVHRGSGVVDLLDAVGAEPDDRVGADGRPRVMHRRVVLADVDAVGGHVEDAFLRLIDVVRRTLGRPVRSTAATFAIPSPMSSTPPK